MKITDFPALKEAHGKLTEKRKALAVIFAEAGPSIDLGLVKSVEGDSAAVADHIKNLNDELTDLGKDVDRLKSVRDAANAASETGDVEEFEAKGESRKQRKSFGQVFVESEAGHGKKGREVEVDFEMKTAFSTSAGWAPETLRIPGFVPDEQRPVQLVDLIPTRTTNQSAVVYMEETTFTNNAAEAAEAAAFGEAALALTEQSNTIRKLAVFIPVTDEQLEDVEGVQQYLDNRLSFMLRQRLDGQLVAGNGTAPNLRGFLNVSGIQTQAKGTDPTPDAIYKAMTKIEVTGQAMANLVVMHPNDWQDVRLLRTADGIYIWGNPSDVGPERIWGLTVAKVQAQTENTGLVLDTNFSELAIKKGITLKVSDSHSDYFTSGKQAVRADMRCALTVFRPSSVCSVTGI